VYPSAANTVASARRPNALRFCTDAFAPGERTAAWREFVGREVLKLEIEPAADRVFRADVTVHPLPGAATVRGWLTPARIDRPRRLIDSDDLVLCMSRQGEVQSTLRNRETTFGSGDAVLMNADSAGALVLSRDSHLVSIRVPRRVVSANVAELDDIVCRRIPADTPALRLLDGYLRIFDQGDMLATTAVRHQAAVHIQDLVALTIGATRDAAEIATERGERAARLHAIKEDITDNLRGNITITAISLRHNCTPRQVQRLFECEGTTFTDYVLAQRLALAHRMLTDPRRAREKVSALADEAGFANLSYFNRAFRRRFGDTPSAVRGGVRRFDA
jgi:AraC-like DNA-binding protein